MPGPDPLLSLPRPWWCKPAGTECAQPSSLRSVARNTLGPGDGAEGISQEGAVV